MNIQRLIIHSLDENLETEILSKKQVNLNDNAYTDEYIKRFAKSCLNSSATYTGRLNAESPFHEIIDSKFEFIEWSRTIAKKHFAFHRTQDASKNLNLLYSLLEHGDDLYLASFEVHGKDGFIRIAKKEDDIENQIVHNAMILPNTFASVQSAFMLNLTSGELFLKGKPEHEEFFETLFDCELIANSKRAFSSMQNAIEDIMEAREEESLPKIIHLKEILGNVASEFDLVSSSDVLEEVLEGMNPSESMRVKENLDLENVEDDLDLRKLRKSRVLSRHRVKTESGIEIILPLNEIDLNQVFQIEENPDGTVDIHIKNIGKLV